MLKDRQIHRMGRPSGVGHFASLQQQPSSALSNQGIQQQSKNSITSTQNRFVIS